LNPTVRRLGVLRQPSALDHDVAQPIEDGGGLVDTGQHADLPPGRADQRNRFLQRVDLAVLQAFKGVKPGITSLGLKEGALDYALDEHNARLVTADMKKRVDAARADIISGKVKVTDFTVANACK